VAKRFFCEKFFQPAIPAPDLPRWRHAGVAALITICNFTFFSQRIKKTGI